MIRDDQDRRAAVTTVLAFAANHPGDGLGYEYLPEVRAVFADRTKLLCALQQEWSCSVRSRIKTLSADPGRRRALSPGQIARIAWAETAVANPALRRLLDDHHAAIDDAAHRADDLLLSLGLRFHIENDACTAR